MSERRSIEISADTVDEAIQRGLAELGVNPWDVMVEIVEEPTLGLFGSPPRQAKVRLQLLRVGPSTPPPSFPRLAQPDAEAARRQQSGNRQQGKGRSGQNRFGYGGGQPRREDPRGDRSQNRGSRGGRGRGDRDRKPVSRLLDNEMVRQQANAFDDDSLYDDLESEGESLFAGYTPVEEADYDADVAVARETLVDILKAMDISGSVQVSRVDAAQGGGSWILNVQGQGRQINALIGRRGDTLAALQYLLRLMVSHRLQHRVNLIVDVDGYKARRAERLRSLAARMAEQAITEARTVVLEPMPAHERRLIHIALRSHPQVETKSIGEGDNRKVTIVPIAGAPNHAQKVSEDDPDEDPIK